MQLNTTDHGLCDTFPEFGDSNTQDFQGIFHYFGVDVFTGQASLEDQNGLLPTLRLNVIDRGGSRIWS